MMTETFDYPYAFFMYFMTSGLVFSMFIHYAIVFAANLQLIKKISGLFNV
jgi:hypothetical protein